MSSRSEIYLAKAEMCEHLAKAASEDSETVQRALRLAHQWREMARDAERVERSRGYLIRWNWLAKIFKRGSA